MYMGWWSCAEKTCGISLLIYTANAEAAEPVWPMSKARGADATTDSLAWMTAFHTQHTVMAVAMTKNAMRDFVD